MDTLAASCWEGMVWSPAALRLALGAAATATMVPERCAPTLPGSKGVGVFAWCGHPPPPRTERAYQHSLD